MGGTVLLRHFYGICAKRLSFRVLQGQFLPCPAAVFFCEKMKMRTMPGVD